MPVGAFSLAANLYFANLFFGETLSTQDKVGTACVLIGAVCIAASYSMGDSPEKEFEVDELIALYFRWSMGLYMLVLGGLTTFFFRINEAGPASSGGLYPPSFAALAGLIGSQSVIFANSTVKLVSEKVFSRSATDDSML